MIIELLVASKFPSRNLKLSIGSIFLFVETIAIAFFMNFFIQTSLKHLETDHRLHFGYKKIAIQPLNQTIRFWYAG